MNSFTRRIGVLEQSASRGRLTWVVRQRADETSAQAIARAQTAGPLASFILIAPEVSASAEDWLQRYARETR
jgi:hypothetical protein